MGFIHWVKGDLNEISKWFQVIFKLTFVIEVSFAKVANQRIFR